MDCSMSGFLVHHQLPELTKTHIHWVGDAIQPSHPLSSPSPPSFNLPSIRVFSNETVLHIRWPKYWSFSFRISPSNEYSGLISFRIDWLDLLAVQGTLKSLLQHHNSKASILHHSAFFMVQLSHPYMTTGKTIALTRWTFVSKVMSLLFNMLSRLVISFLPRNKRLLISWLQYHHLQWYSSLIIDFYWHFGRNRKGWIPPCNSFLTLYFFFLSSSLDFFPSLYKLVSLETIQSLQNSETW